MAKIITLITKFILAIIAAFFFASCGGSYNYNSIKGDGIVTEESRNTGENFNAIEASSGIKVVVEQESTTAVKVKADSNLMKHIFTKVENGTLNISADTNFRSDLVIVTVKVPELKSVNASSASRISSNSVFKSNNFDIEASSGASVNINVEADNIQISSSSASHVTVTGKALSLITDASSAAKIDANDLWANDVEADASSGAAIEVHPIVKLDADASSGGSIEYDTKPTEMLRISTSSGGGVSKK
jgi:Putative auto-transporter adhesin, head GIN domain